MCALPHPQAQHASQQGIQKIRERDKNSFRWNLNCETTGINWNKNYNKEASQLSSNLQAKSDIEKGSKKKNKSNNRRSYLHINEGDGKEGSRYYLICKYFFNYHRSWTSCKEKNRCNLCSKRGKRTEYSRTKTGKFLFLHTTLNPHLQQVPNPFNYT